ncbi:hypothetical protein CXB51_017365 [Gossypium anomalum]|uniref:Pentatricopeptide repeat-containing protein n=1 Tax=Gossypium anomalum TaxID=47600 RepID=A0A8J5Z609_9ROSI|nr:hypothetical protein CXB51_017365 [Gossypium anomalum]
MSPPLNPIFVTLTLPSSFSFSNLPFSLIDDLLIRLNSNQYWVTSTFFCYLIKIYAEADLPKKALNIFYKILEFNIKPLPRHLNRILELLVSHRNFIMPAFDLFNIAHK